MFTREKARVTAADGYSLACTVLRPTGDKPLRHAVLICPAMGVRQAYYKDFAEFVAEQGCGVVTFDNRGIAESAPKHLRGFSAKLQDWGQLDAAAMIAHARKTFPELPLSAVIHSVGGQVLGLAPNIDELESVVALGSQSGYWRHWDGLNRIRVWILWHLLIPILAPLLGYFPSKLFGLGRDIPRNVALQWAHWGRHPHYVVGRSSPEERSGFDTWAGRIRVIAASDDWLAPERAARALLAFYKNADQQFRLADPTQLGLPHIGHFGYFRKSICAKLWPAQVAWLLGDK